MFTLEDIKAKLKDMKLRRVAKEANLHPATLYRLMRGSEPLHSTVVALNAYLSKQ